MKILHFADAHVGITAHGKTNTRTGLNTRIEAVLHSLDKVAQCAERRDVDAILFAGDAYRNASPDMTSQREFAKRVRRMAGLAPVVLLVGNHDRAANMVKAHAMSVFDALAVDNVHVISEPQVLRIETKSGPLQVAGAPYQRAGMAEVVTNLAAQVRHDAPAVLLAHCSVGGAIMGAGQTVTLEQDAALPPEALDHPAFHYVALGHIHKHQVIAGSRPIVYAGSVERMDFGEEGEPKCCIVVEIGEGGAGWQACSLPATDFRTIRIDVRPVVDPQGVIEQALRGGAFPGEIVRVIISCYESQKGAIRQQAILKRLDGAAAAYLHFDLERVARPLRVDAPLHRMTPLELLALWFAQRGESVERTERLLQRAAGIMEIDPAEVAPALAAYGRNETNDGIEAALVALAALQTQEA